MCQLFSLRTPPPSSRGPFHTLHLSAPLFLVTWFIHVWDKPYSYFFYLWDARHHLPPSRGPIHRKQLSAPVSQVLSHKSTKWNNSGLTYEWGILTWMRHLDMCMRHLDMWVRHLDMCMRHVSHTKEACFTYERGMFDIWMASLIYNWDMSLKDAC